MLTDKQANIQYIRGDVSPYFKLPEGNVKDNLNAVDMARPELRFALQSMIHKASKTGQAVTSNTIGFNENQQGVRIKVGPALHDNHDAYRLVVFIPVEPSLSAMMSASSLEDAGQERMRDLEQELALTREHLQDTIEELESSTEELQSLNEELQAANEELQATNEELNTVNDELRAKSDEAAELLDNLTDSERRYRRLVDNMNEALMLCEIEYGPDKRPTDLFIQQANKALEDLLAIKHRDLPLRAGAAQLQELVSVDMLKRFEAIAKGEKPQRFELHLNAPEKDLTLSVYNMGEDRLGVVCRDDTERERAVEALAASERKYRELLETANSIVIRWDNQGVIRYINEYGLRFFGYSAAEVLNRDVMIIVPKVEKSSGRDLDSLVKDIIVHPEQHTYVPSENITKDGQTVWVAWTNKAIRDERGEVQEILTIGNDITALKHTEEALRRSQERLKASLAEKEILLMEIHHRVKNNMQIISSLVSLQTDVLEDDATRSILQDIRHRVKSMAMVHEKLYRAADLSNLEFADYSKSLLNYLWQFHASETSGVKLTTDLEPVSLTVNAAVPCGLILNELVSNALKHAFKGRDDGELNVSLRSNGPSGLRLRVKDNGIGLPPELDWRQAGSLGLRLIQLLANQLHAAVEVTTGDGTEFMVAFENPK